MGKKLIQTKQNIYKHDSSILQAKYISNNSISLLLKPHFEFVTKKQNLLTNSKKLTVVLKNDH